MTSTSVSIAELVDGRTRTSLSASGTINRNDFGVAFAMPLDGGDLALSGDVQNTLEFQGAPRRLDVVGGTS